MYMHEWRAHADAREQHARYCILTIHVSKATIDKSQASYFISYDGQKLAVLVLGRRSCHGGVGERMLQEGSLETPGRTGGGALSSSSWRASSLGTTNDPGAP
jgi:hypothetical protein